MTAEATMTLGERCVLWCRDQMQRELVPSRETLARWFEPVGRGLENMIRAGQKLNHCAATQCAAARACALADENVPHGYHAGAKQLMSDAIERGCWHPQSEVLAGVWMPRVGDLAIYDRSTPGKPETAWYGHVDRVSRVFEQTYENIGANEGPGGAWRLEVTRYDYSRLLGFVAYPQLDPARETKTVHVISDEERARVLGLVALTLAEASWWEEQDGSEHVV